MTKHRLRRGARAVALAGAAVVLPGCTDWAMYDVDVALGEVQVFSTMRRDVIPDPYAMPRMPPEGSVPLMSPHGDVPPPYTQAELDAVAATLTNPLESTPEVLARGQVVYDRFCAVCHGTTGAGDGPVVRPGAFPFATVLSSGATVDRSDGYLYAVTDVGRGLMPPYGDRIGHMDRWAVVAYVRQLQGRHSVPQPGPDVTPEGRAVEALPAPADTPAAEVPGAAGTR